MAPGHLLRLGTRPAARLPFALLIMVLLAIGLIGLLLLNSAVNQGSFQLSRLTAETTRLTDEEQALQQEVDEWAEPSALAERARELGMVPGGNPVFLDPDGRIRGDPSMAAGPTAGAASATPANQSPAPSPAPSAAPSATPSATAGP